MSFDVNLCCDVVDGNNQVHWHFDLGLCCVDGGETRHMKCFGAGQDDRIQIQTHTFGIGQCAIDDIQTKSYEFRRTNSKCCSNDKSVNDRVFNFKYVHWPTGCGWFVGLRFLWILTFEDFLFHV